VQSSHSSGAGAFGANARGARASRGKRATWREQNTGCVQGPSGTDAGCTFGRIHQPQRAFISTYDDTTSYKETIVNVSTITGHRSDRMQMGINTSPLLRVRPTVVKPGLYFCAAHITDAPGPNTAHAAALNKRQSHSHIDDGYSHFVISTCQMPAPRGTI
jgi:hypothetical protein